MNSYGNKDMKTLNLLVVCTMFSTAPLFGQRQKPEPLYDEAQVPAYTLPALLITEKGKAVKDVTQWENKRRAEILKSFSEQVYGKTPGKKVLLNFEQQSVDEQALGGKATQIGRASCRERLATPA